MAELAVFDKDPNIYLFTSLTAGSSHIVTATSRIETILRANKIPFIGLDTATHELGKKLFQRRAAGKKLPLLVKEGYVLGGIEEIEEWNEYDELHEALGVDTGFTANPPKPTSLFEPSPSKTPPPLADALPGGFSFGQSAGPAFGSLAGAANKGVGSKLKENTPVASSEQNLAIRQMGAEAAKIAASKKPTPVKISTTNPLLTEKVNANSPADVLSPKSTPLPKSPNTAVTKKSEEEAEKTDLPDILSPRSIPLPETPGVAPRLQQQKPVHAPPSMHDDAENPALSAGPIKTTQAKKDSSEEGEEEDSSEDESRDESASEETVEKTQEQDPKDAGKAGVTVEEGEQAEEDKTEALAKDDIEEKAEVEAKVTDAKIAEIKPAETGAAEPKVTEMKAAEAQDATPAPQPMRSSKEETSENDESSEESEEEQKKEKDTLTETKGGEVKKPQAEEAKDASKAGESILD